jgi:sigma-E factor negative regulatory protein RseA
MNDDTPSLQREQTRQSLSRLMDGDACELEAGCRAFGGDAASRVDWYAYHLIGDALRSSDIDASPQRDAAFLARWRARMADEPAVMAPAPLAAPPTAPRAAAPSIRRQPWTARVAVAAGFALVAGALVVTRGDLSGDASGDRVAIGTVNGATSNAVNSAVNGGVPMRQAAWAAGGASSAVPASLIEGVMLRNSDLDRYLEAHREYAPNGALSGGAAVRRAAVLAPTP